jgi:integrase
MTLQMPSWMSEPELAERWGESTYSVQRKRKLGLIKAKRFGRGWKYRTDWILEYENQADNQCQASSGSEHFFLDRRPNSPIWCACWFDPASRQTRRSSLGTADFQEAKILLAKHAITHEELKNAKPHAVPLEQVFIRYWEGHAKHLPSAEQARITMGLWSDLLPEITVAELTPECQEVFIADLERKAYKPSYISRVISVGRAALTRAWKRGEITSIPFIMDVQRDPEAEAERYRDLDPEEVARLLSASARIAHLLMFDMLSLNTMARPDAVLDLGPVQVDLGRRLIALNPKGRKHTKKYRPVVPISNALLPWVTSADGSHFVMFNGKPVSDIKKSFKQAVKEAGLSRVTPYCLRHTMATELRTRGVPEWELQGMLGHKSPNARTTERYAKFRPDYLSEAVEAIDNYFAELKADFASLLGPVLNPVRASSVLVPKLRFPQVVERMVVDAV